MAGPRPGSAELPKATRRGHFHPAGMPEALLEATPLESACSTDLLSRRAESGTRPEFSVPAWFSGLWAVLRSNRAIAGGLGAAAILARPIGPKSDSKFEGC